MADYTWPPPGFLPEPTPQPDLAQELATALPEPVQWPPQEWTTPDAVTTAAPVPHEPTPGVPEPPVTDPLLTPEPAKAFGLSSDLGDERLDIAAPPTSSVKLAPFDPAPLADESVSGHGVDGSLDVALDEFAPWEGLNETAQEVLEDESSNIENIPDEDLGAYGLNIKAAIVDAENRKHLATGQQLRMEIAQDERDRAQEQIDARRQLAIEESDKAIAMAAELGQRPDPNRWYKNRSTGQRIAGFLAAGLGGMASLRTGRNQFLDRVQREVANDIELQKLEIAQGARELKTQQGIVAQLFRETGDLEKAADVAHVASLHAIQRDIAQLAAQYDPRGTRGMAAAQAHQAWQGELAKAEDKLRKTQFDREIKLDERKEAWAKHQLAREKFAAEQRPRGGGGGGAGRPTSLLGDDLAAALGVTKSGDRSRIVLVNPSAPAGPQMGDMALTAGDATKAREMLADSSNLVRALDNLDTLVQKHGFEVTGDRLGSEAGKQIDGAFSRAITLTNKTAGLGALAGSDLELLQKQLGGDFGKLSRASGLKALRDHRRAVVAEANERLSRTGVRTKYAPPRPKAVQATGGVSLGDLTLKISEPGIDANTRRQRVAEAVDHVQSVKGPIGKRLARELTETLRALPPEDRQVGRSVDGGRVGDTEIAQPMDALDLVEERARKDARDRERRQAGDEKKPKPKTIHSPLSRGGL